MHCESLEKSLIQGDNKAGPCLFENYNRMQCLQIIKQLLLTLENYWLLMIRDGWEGGEPTRERGFSIEIQSKIPQNR